MLLKKNQDPEVSCIFLGPYLIQIHIHLLILILIGKRSQQTAALESGSNVVPREMARLGSGQVGAGAGGGLLDTPDCSGQISGGQPGNTGHMSGYLNNCRQINDL